MGLSTLAAKADAAKVRSVVNERKWFETMAEGEQRQETETTGILELCDPTPALFYTRRDFHYGQ